MIGAAYTQAISSLFTGFYAINTPSNINLNLIGQGGSVTINFTCNAYNFSDESAVEYVWTAEPDGSGQTINIADELEQSTSIYFATFADSMSGVIKCRAVDRNTSDEYTAITPYTIRFN